MSDLVNFDNEFITFQNPNGISVYNVSGELELIGSATGGARYEIVDQDVATVPPRRHYIEAWDHGNIHEDNVNIYAFKVNYCELEKNIGPYGSSGTGLRVVESGTWSTYSDYTGKVKEGSYFNLRYNDSANFHLNLDWSAVTIPSVAHVNYGTYTYIYRCSDFISESGSTASRIYTAYTNEPKGALHRKEWNTPVIPSSFNLEYDKPTVLNDTSNQWREDWDNNNIPIKLSAFKNYQDIRMPLYVYQIFGASNSISYERYLEITASGGQPDEYSYSALKMWPGQWSGTISAVDVPEFISY